MIAITQPAARSPRIAWRHRHANHTRGEQHRPSKETPVFTIFQRRTLQVMVLCAMIAAAFIAASGAPAAYGQTASPAAQTAAAPIASVTGEDDVLRFDVAENATRFVFAEQPVHDDGMPAYGNAFVTQGYIYPEGTLDGTNGVLADGSPEFPDQVLGEWTCRGWFIGDGAHTTTGAWVVTTQIYGFADAILITDGYEIADIGVPGERAITGGTGPYASVTGDGEQILLGFNATEGANLRVTLNPAMP
jgi:hypothetical protein